jgi:hypothetical protein
MVGKKIKENHGLQKLTQKILPNEIERDGFDELAHRNEVLSELAAR